jgi:hypothetical protein
MGGAAGAGGRVYRTAEDYSEGFEEIEETVGVIVGGRPESASTFAGELGGRKVFR